MAVRAALSSFILRNGKYPWLRMVGHAWFTLVACLASRYGSSVAPGLPQRSHVAQDVGHLSGPLGKVERTGCKQGQLCLPAARVGTVSVAKYSSEELHLCLVRSHGVTAPGDSFPGCTTATSSGRRCWVRGIGQSAARLGIVSRRCWQGKTFLLRALAEATGGFYYAARRGRQPAALAAPPGAALAAHWPGGGALPYAIL